MPPAEIAANRTELVSLLQTNIFGQNNAAIAALEAEYAQFWAQDVAAVTGYAGSSQAATTGLGSFTEAPQTTNDSGQATQAGRDRGRRYDTGPSDLETILEQIEADATNFLNQVSQFNTDYTKFFTSAINSLPGGSIWPRRGRTCTRSSREPVARPPGPTWSTAPPVWASRSGRTSSSTSPGATESVWVRSTVDCPRPADISGASGAWERGRRLRLWAARRRWANCRCHPAGPAPPRRSGSPLRRCRTALLPRRQLRRWRSPLSALNQATLGQLGRWRAGQPGLPRRQLDGRAGQGDHARALEGTGPARQSHRELQESARRGAALERRRGRSRRPGRQAVDQARHPRRAPDRYGKSAAPSRRPNPDWDSRNQPPDKEDR